MRNKTFYSIFIIGIMLLSIAFFVDNVKANKIYCNDEITNENNVCYQENRLFQEISFDETYNIIKINIYTGFNEPKSFFGGQIEIRHENFENETAIFYQLFDGENMQDETWYSFQENVYGDCIVYPNEIYYIVLEYSATDEIDGIKWFYNEFGYNYCLFDNNPDLPSPLGSSGWDLVSLLVNQTISKYDLCVSNGINYYGWNYSVTNEIVLGFLYGWNGANYDTVDSIQAFHGYWIYFYDTDYHIIWNETTGGGCSGVVWINGSDANSTWNISLDKSDNSNTTNITVNNDNWFLQNGFSFDDTSVMFIIWLFLAYVMLKNQNTVVVIILGMFFSLIGLNMFLNQSAIFGNIIFLFTTLSIYIVSIAYAFSTRSK